MNLDFLNSGYGYNNLVSNPAGNMPNAAGTGLNFGNYQQGSPGSLLAGSGPITQGGGGDGTSFLGQDGWGNMALGGLQTGFGIFQGMKQLDLAKDQLDFQKKAFEKNYAAQRQGTNTQLRDRQKRRAYERPDYYQSVGEYMKKNEVK